MEVAWDEIAAKELRKLKGRTAVSTRNGWERKAASVANSLRIRVAKKDKIVREKAWSSTWQTAAVRQLRELKERAQRRGQSDWSHKAAFAVWNHKTRSHLLKSA